MNGTPPDDETGLPLLHSWRAVYICVLVTFIVWDVLLTALSTIS